MASKIAPNSDQRPTYLRSSSLTPIDAHIRDLGVASPHHHRLFSHSEARSANLEKDQVDDTTIDIHGGSGRPNDIRSEIYILHAFFAEGSCRQAYDY